MTSNISHTNQPHPLLHAIRSSQEAFSDTTTRICANLVSGMPLPLIDGSLLRWFEVSDLIQQSPKAIYYAPKRGLYILPSQGGDQSSRSARLARIIETAHALPFCSWLHLGEATDLRIVLEASLQEASTLSHMSTSLWRQLWDDLCRDHEHNLTRLHESKRFMRPPHVTHTEPNPKAP